MIELKKIPEKILEKGFGKKFLKKLSLWIKINKPAACAMILNSYQSIVSKLVSTQRWHYDTIV